ncbi:hypothetical protein Trco_006163 [Trichoderma cornu-damae]|uniref:Uncharacterized protein n=1 Tax=Trichoderma cornu-damae TaxID=654480 RepID=A0A9P8QIK3_9HYPO|nr:hypothetical protein Trco_006163 [Trichoderma cornu-damae]
MERKSLFWKNDRISSGIFYVVFNVWVSLTLVEVGLVSGLPLRSTASVLDLSGFGSFDLPPDAAETDPIGWQMGVICVIHELDQATASDWVAASESSNGATPRGSPAQFPLVRVWDGPEIQRIGNSEPVGHNLHLGLALYLIGVLDALRLHADGIGLPVEGVVQLPPGMELGWRDRFQYSSLFWNQSSGITAYRSNSISILRFTAITCVSER